MAVKLNRFVKELSKKEILVPHLNRWFSTGKFPDEIPFSIHPNKPGDDAFHPSSHATGCIRYLYAMSKGDVPPEKLTAQSQKTFQIGHMYHAWIQWILVEGLGFSEWSDIEKRFASPKIKTDLGNEWWMTGATDVASCLVPGQDKPMLVDIKTMRGQSYNQPRMAGWLWEKYEAQLQLYMDWHDRDIAIMLCCNKDGPHEFKEYIIRRNPDKVDKIYKQWGRLADALAEDAPPECDCHSPKCPASEIYDETYSI